MKEYKKILTEKLGNKLHYYEEVDSSNNVAKEMKDWEHGSVIIAETQTAGRGTYGRTFHSRVRNGIYMTLIIDTNRWSFRNEQLATIYTAVAASEAIVEITNISSEIKWVNDLFVSGKKIGGILTEKDSQSNKLIIGIGINVSGKQEDFPIEIQNTAASLELSPPTDHQAAAIVLAIYMRMFEPKTLPDDQAILQRYKEKLFIMGQTVDISQGNDVFEAKVIDVDEQGRLVVLKKGEKLALGVGEVRVKV